RVVDDQALSVHLEVGDEAAPRALVAIGRGVEAPVALLERLEGQAREAEPRRAHRRLLADRQPEPADRQDGGGGAPVEVDAEAPAPGGTPAAADPPPPRGIHGDPDRPRPPPPPAAHARRPRAPAAVADHPIVESARLLLVGEDRRADEVPVL